MSVLSLKQLLELRQQVRYLIYPILPQGGLMVIGAPAKSRKSFFSLNLAYQLAEGGHFLGWKCEGQQRVLYVEHEIGQLGLKQRMTQIHAHFGGDFVEENLKFVCKGKDHVSLTGEQGFKRLQSLVEDVNPDVIILDPLRRFHHSDEDSSTEMTRVFDAVDKLQENGDCRRTLILVHHTSKPSEQRDRTNPESLRGSSFIFDAGDSYLMLQPGKSGQESMKLHCKFRHAPDIEVMSLNFNGDTGVFTRKEKGDF